MSHSDPVPSHFDVGAVLAQHAHRPFALPKAPWLVQQQWLDVLFAHWRVAPEVLRRHIPSALTVELMGGAAWLGVVAFAIRGLRARALPGVPTATDFLELNVRTYVNHRGRAGVFFFSLDAASALAVLGARTLFRLPYHRARMRSESRNGWIVYESARRVRPEVRFHARYRAAGDVFMAAPGSLDHFLTERYCLFTVSGARVARVDIHHPPWPLQLASAELRENGMALPLGLALGRPPELLHFAAHQCVINWAPARETPG